MKRTFLATVLISTLAAASASAQDTSCPEPAELEATIRTLASEHAEANGGTVTVDDFFDDVAESLDEACRPAQAELREIISLHIGQAGTQVGRSAAEPAPGDTTPEPAEATQQRGRR